MTPDEKRLLWVAWDSGIDGFGDGPDFHERASQLAADNGKEEPGDAEYLAAIKESIDELMGLAYAESRDPSTYPPEKRPDAAGERQESK